MKREHIAIHTPFIKLDALLKFTGQAISGGQAKDWILNGDILVDGEVCLQRGRKIQPGMVVTLAGEIEYEVVGGED